MIGRDQQWSAPMCLVSPSVPERKGRSGANRAVALKNTEIRSQGYGPEGDYHLHLRKQAEFSFEEWAASQTFFGGGLVIGRNTSDRGGNVGISEHQAVITCGAETLVGKSGLEESPIQKFPRAVAREHPAGPIGSMRARSQA